MSRRESPALPERRWGFSLSSFNDVILCMRTSISAGPKPRAINLFAARSRLGASLLRAVRKAGYGFIEGRGYGTSRAPPSSPFFPHLNSHLFGRCKSARQKEAPASVLSGPGRRFAATRCRGA